MMKQHFRTVWLLSLLFTLLISGASAYADEPYAADLERLSNVFVCNCNCGTQINPFDVTQCPTATVFKKEVLQMLTEGKSEIEIRDHYVAEFGETILRAPLKKGFSLAAWISPFAALALGVIGLTYLLRRRIRHARTLAGPMPAVALNGIEQELYQDMIDLERKKYL